MDRIKESAKALAALIGGIATAVIAVGVDNATGHILAIVSAVATAVVTWAATNTPSGVVSNQIDVDHTDGE